MPVQSLQIIKLLRVAQTYSEIEILQRFLWAIKVVVQTRKNKSKEAFLLIPTDFSVLLPNYL